MISYRTAIILTSAWILIAGCSTRRNTAGTRFYHALTTRYNVYFNGQEAYKNGVLAQVQGHKDNYMELLPLYPTDNKETARMGSGDFDRAIEKAQKAIRQHSIKRRPVRRQGGRYTAEYRQWLARREFNPFLHNAWMLLGKAQYRRGNYGEAAATFAYIARLYNGQPGITSEALIRLSQCYTAMGWTYDAEDALNRVNNDSLPASLLPAYNSATCYLLLANRRYHDAIPLLKSVAANERNSTLKARNYYLLGQLHQQLKQPAEAYWTYKKVNRLNPPYELALSARVRQTEVMPDEDGRSIINKLQRLGKDVRNEEFLDRIYYAMGNVHLSRKDTAEAINAYRKGIAAGERGNKEKGVLQLTLGNLYWHRMQYAEAQAAYAEAIGLMENTHPEYEQTMRRSEILDELVPYTTVIRREDSLQHIAALPEAERLRVIEEIIVQVTDREEKAREAEKEAAKQAFITKARTQAEEYNNGASPNSGGTHSDRQTSTAWNVPAAGNNRAWYFYNPQLMEQGKAEFHRQWGNRKLEDNWRRRNKTVVDTDRLFATADYDEDTVYTHDLPTGQAAPGALPKDAGGNTGRQQHPSVSPPDGTTEHEDTPTDDNRQPAYYLSRLPLTEEAKRNSDRMLAEALYAAGRIFKERMESFGQAEAAFERIIRQYPDFPLMDEAYYHLYLTRLAANYYRKPASQHSDNEFLLKAERCRQELTTRFPESRYTRLLNDPEFIENAIHGKQREDSLYAHAYELFRNGDITGVRNANRLSTGKYPFGQHRPKFLFLNAATYLQSGDTRTFLTVLKELIRDYPQNEITDLAAHILKGVQEGRTLMATGSSSASAWKRRNDGSGEYGTQPEGSADSLPDDSLFSTERDVEYYFLLAYEPGQINEHMLLFDIARYNFTTFLVKNFDLDFISIRGVNTLRIASFANYDEAYLYFRQLYSSPTLKGHLDRTRAVIISSGNYERLASRYSFDDYDTFYRRHFAVIPEPELKGYTLDEPLDNLPDEKENGQREENLLKETSEPENGVIFEP